MLVMIEEFNSWAHAPQCDSVFTKSLDRTGNTGRGFHNHVITTQSHVITIDEYAQLNPKNLLLTAQSREGRFKQGLRH